MFVVLELLADVRAAYDNLPDTVDSPRVEEAQALRGTHCMDCIAPAHKHGAGALHSSLSVPRRNLHEDPGPLGRAEGKSQPAARIRWHLSVTLNSHRGTVLPGADLEGAGSDARRHDPKWRAT